MTGTDLETATGETPMVAVRGVHKFFGDLHVLRGIDLDIAAGEGCVILGPSGSGKSTVSKELASRLGIGYLDTGAMYRALAWWCAHEGVDLDDREAGAAASPA